MKQICDFREGVEFAKKILRPPLKSGPFQPIPISKAGALRSQVLQSDGVHMINENPDELIRKSEIDPDCFDALRFGASAHMFAQNELPATVREWVVEYLQGKKERPIGAPGRKSSIGWHIHIAFAVDLLVSSGMTALRNDESNETSACDAVARALSELRESPNSFSRVKKIWLDTKKARGDDGVMEIKP